MLLSADNEFLDRPEIRSAALATPDPSPNILWTDESSDLFSILKWRRDLLPTALPGR